MPGMNEKTTQIIEYVNLTLVITGILLLVLILLVTIRLKTRRAQMGFFLYAACSVLVGLGFQIADRFSSADMGDTQYFYARVMYSLVAPVFCLYFMETEYTEGEVWDKRFWASLQFLISLLSCICTVFGNSYFLTELISLVQYLVVMFMLMFSSKSITACIGFILGTLFPVTGTILGMVDQRIDLFGFSLTMMLLTVLFLYQLDTEREMLKSRAELSEKKVSLLMEQIHPHFIYNSLQQIAILSEEDQQAVKPAIQNFSGYLRRKFQALTGETMIPFSAEMEHVDMYIKLAQILPSRKFEVEKDLAVTDFYLPPLSLQPLVENAIQYGVGMSEKGEKVRIETRREKGYIVISVEDDGHGGKTQLQTQKSYKSVGTENVRTRLRLLCDGKLSVKKQEKGTLAEIRIPEGRAKPEIRGTPN